MYIILLLLVIRDIACIIRHHIPNVIFLKNQETLMCKKYFK